MRPRRRPNQHAPQSLDDASPAVADGASRLAREARHRPPSSTVEQEASSRLFCSSLGVRFYVPAMKMLVAGLA